MFYNHLKIALRLLSRNKLVSAINILGLALALTGSLMIGIFIHDELSYDRYHGNSNHIYRVTRNFLSPDGSVSLHLGLVAAPFGPLLKNDFPDIKESGRIRRCYEPLSIEEGGKFKERLSGDNSYYAEPSVFKIFSIPIIAGDTKSALEKPFTMMVSDVTAEKYFGTKDVVGRQLKIDNAIVEITGVYKAFPRQSHWHADILVSFNTLNDDRIWGREKLETSWSENNFSTYILVDEQFDRKKAENQLPAFVDKHMGDPGNPELPSSWTNLFLQPLTSIHLHSHLDFELEANGSINHVYTMSAIGVFLILIACFNFINLSTARATTRGKEVGLRKVVGAFKRQLVIQHLSESIFIAFLSFFLSIVFISMAMPWLNDFTGKSLQLSDYATPSAIFTILGFMTSVGIMAGLYPAFIISAFKPALALKGQNGSVKGSGGIRKVLVVVQFSISIIMIIATLITYQQLNFLNERELGYAKDQVVMIGYENPIMEHYDAYYHELTKNPAILNATRSSLIPTDRLLASRGTSVEQGDSLVATEINMKDVRIDHEFFNTYKIPFVSGRNFSREVKTDDSLAFIINETAAKMVGWSNEDAIGKVLKNGHVKGRVIGVVQDFHFESLHEPIVPVVFHGEKSFNRISVLVSESKMKEGLAHMEKVWNQFVVQRPFDYSFLAARYNWHYKSEQSQNELFIIFAVLAIFIASMGLFGLATFNTLQRRKEVSIRKVLGAPIASIVQLLSKEILILILVANVVAWPIAWYCMTEWLNGFAYHIEMTIFTYFFAGVLAMVITLITIGSQTLKAALINPATILKNE
jgi:putative ABC transport system permease protein